MTGGVLDTAVNVAELVTAAAERTPDRAAVCDEDERLSWAQLEQRVEEHAAVLSGLTEQPGERVALLLPAGVRFAAWYFAVLRSGLTAVPVNTSLTGAEVAHVLSDSGATAVLVDGADGRPVPVSAARVIHVGSSAAPAGTTDVADLPRVVARHAGGSEACAALLYTSGTTGKPRAAMLPHRALLANLRQLAALDPAPVRPDDTVLVIPPLYHVYGLNAGLGLVAAVGATAVLVNRFDPVETLGLVRRHRVTNVIGAPPVYVAWSLLPDVGPAFETVRIAVSGAAALPPDVMESMQRATGRPLFEGYGLTETAPVLTSTLVSGRPKPGSVGRPLPGVELRLLDESGHPAEDGDPGEVTVRGANLFAGYWPDGAGGPDADGWYRTGDVGYRDEEGDLHIVDRLRDLVIVSGFNVYPAEVEQVLEAHPDVVEAAVVGAPHPYTGETVRAFVVRRPGSTLGADELLAHAQRSLARFKCPTSIEFVSELPHSVVGKVARARLTARGPDAGPEPDAGG